MSYVRFFLTAAATAMILLAAITPTGVILAQVTIDDVGREVIVMFRPNTLELPEGVTQSTVEQLAVVAPNIRDLLIQHGVDRIRKAFPDFNRADTLRVTPEGLTVSSIDLSRVFVLRLPSNENRDNVITRLQRLPQVLYAEPNATGRPRIIPNDTHFGLQWSLRNTGQSGGMGGADVKATDAWDVFTGSSSVIIGIVDIGRVMQNHPDLTGRVSGNLSTPIESHSTHVAGIAAAKGNNSTGIAGVDWNAQINTQTMSLDIAQQAAAIRAAADAGARIINNSWGQGSNVFSVTAKQAFVYAYKLNAVSSNAMPEEGSTEDYPNAYGQGIINVGATNNQDARAWYSHARTYIDVAAPGGNGELNQPTRDILSTVNYSTGYGQYDFLAGTSMAAPHVAGIASLMKGYAQQVLGITLYNDDIEQIIRLGIDDINDPNDPTTGPGWDQGTGTGRVNAKKALDYLRAPWTVNQYSAVGGTVVGITSQLVSVSFYGASGGCRSLADGSYLIKRLDVRKVVNFPQTFSSNFVWGRGVGTTGWTTESPNFGTGYCNVTWYSNSQAELQTFLYDVYYHPGRPWDYKGRYPCDPQNVTFAYTVLGISSLPKAAESSLTENTLPPEDFTLFQNFPNPFNPETTIRFGLPQDVHVQLMIIDLLGRQVRTLVESDFNAGFHSVVWDGRDNAGYIVPSGMYFYQIVAGAFQERKKLALVR